MRDEELLTPLSRRDPALPHPRQGHGHVQSGCGYLRGLQYLCQPCRHCGHVVEVLLLLRWLDSCAVRGRVPVLPRGKDEPFNRVGADTNSPKTKGPSLEQIALLFDGKDAQLGRINAVADEMLDEKKDVAVETRERQ